MWDKFFFTDEMANEATEKFEKLDGFLKHYRDTSFVGMHHWIFRFGDGRHSHGASIIAGPGTCTCVGHPFELAVVFFPFEKDEDNKYDLDYDTEITDDVVGCNTFEEIVELLDRIRNLD